VVTTPRPFKHSSAPNVARVPSYSKMIARAPAQRWLPLLGALVFASILAWMPGELYRDRDNYTAYLEYAPAQLLFRLDGDIISTLTNEPLFLLMNVALTTLFSVEQALQLLIFVPAAIVAYNVLRASPRNAVYLLAVLLAPAILQKHIVHLRQGLAISIFIMGWFAVTPRLRWSIIALTPFIHASFFFVLGLMAANWTMRKLRISPWVIVYVFAMLGVLIGLSLEDIARASGARQSDEYEFAAAQGISGAGFVFWSAMLGLFLAQSRRFLREHALEVGSVAFYLSTYFLSPVTARVFESTMLIVLLSVLKMTGSGRLAFMTAIVLFVLLQWLMIFVGLAPTFTVTDL